MDDAPVARVCSPSSEYVVRRFRPEDAASFLSAVRASLPGLARDMPWCKEGYALGDASAWIAFAQGAWSRGSEFPLGIFESGSGAVVGGTGINQVNTVHRTGNLGYWVSTRHRGRRVARLAARQAALIGFGELGLTRLEIVVLPGNVASQRVAEALGATLECTARNRLHVRGHAQDAMVYSLTPDDARASAFASPCPQSTWRRQRAAAEPVQGARVATGLRVTRRQALIPDSDVIKSYKADGRRA